VPLSVNDTPSRDASFMPPPEVLLPDDELLLLVPLPLLVLLPLPLEEPLDDDELELPLSSSSNPPLLLLHPGNEARPTKDKARQTVIVRRCMRAPRVR
jgi:hypothetical protein